MRATTRLITCIAAPALVAVATATAANETLTIEPEAAVTIVPVVLAGNPMRDVADVVGMLLEQQGLANVSTTDTALELNRGTPPAEVAAALAATAREESLNARYLVFAEIAASREMGVTGVDIVLADGSGTLLWSDHQATGVAAFDSASPANPMECSQFIVQRLGTILDLPGTPVEDGPMARRWAAKSGTPPKEEYEAMDARVELMAPALGAGAQVLVLPIRLGDETSAVDAAELAERLGTDLQVTASVGANPVQIEVEPARNQMKMLWQMATAFREHVREHPPETDYVLFADYYLRPDGGPARAVHFAICDRSGDLVVVDFQNSHHEDYQAIAPNTTAECSRLVVRRLGTYLD
jgi:hypothetical protein